jgi:integrase
VGPRCLRLRPGRHESIRAPRTLAPADLRCTARSHAHYSTPPDLRILEPPLLPKLTRMFVRLAREAGLSDLTLHGLRHTYATASLQAGIPPKVVSQRLGHANTAITSDLYQHVLKAMDAEAATTLARLILEGEQRDSEPSAVNPLSTGQSVPDAERR